MSTVSKSVDKAAVSLSSVSGKLTDVTLPQTDWNYTKSSTRFRGIPFDSTVAISVEVPAGQYNTIVDQFGATKTPGQTATFQATITPTDYAGLAERWVNFTHGWTKDTTIYPAACVGLNEPMRVTEFPSVEYNANQFVLTNAAQRENKWSVKLRDTVTREIYNFEIPCANTGAMIDHKEEWPPTVVESFRTFLAGPTIQVHANGTAQEGDEQASAAADWEINTKPFPLIVSKNGNPLEYVASTYIGRHFSKN